MTQEDVRNTVLKLLKSNIQENIYLAINIISDKPDLIEEFKKEYFIDKYIKTQMNQKEFEMWADIAFKK